MREGLEVLLAARVWKRDRPRAVHTVELEVKRAARAFAGDVHVDAVSARLLDINRETSHSPGRVHPRLNLPLAASRHSRSTPVFRYGGSFFSWFSGSKS